MLFEKIVVRYSLMETATQRIASTKEYAKFFAKNFAQRLFAVARASLFCGTILLVAHSLTERKRLLSQIKINKLFAYACIVQW